VFCVRGSGELALGVPVTATTKKALGALSGVDTGTNNKGKPSARSQSLSGIPSRPFG